MQQKNEKVNMAQYRQQVVGMLEALCEVLNQQEIIEWKKAQLIARISEEIGHSTTRTLAVVLAAPRLVCDACRKVRVVGSEIGDAGQCFFCDKGIGE